MRGALPVCALALCLAVSGSASAAGPSSPHSFQFRLGGFFPQGGGELWNDNEEVFTLDSSDFDDAMLGFSYVHSLSNHVELGLNVDFYDAAARSQYRDFVDQDGFPIFHDTRLELVPMSVDLRFLPAGRYGRRGSSGQHRVVHPVPYFGAGIGTNYWEYEEVGDFLDFSFDPPVVFPDRFIESGFAFETHALAGLELPFGDHWSFLLEGRYFWMDDEPSGDFEGLGELDMSGFAGYVGFAWRF